MNVVLFVDHCVEYGGAQRFLGLLLSSIDGTRCRRLVVIPQKKGLGPWIATLRALGCEVVVMPLTRGFRHDFLAALFLFRRLGGQVVHFTRISDGHFLGAILAARLAGCRVVVTEQWSPVPMPRLPRRRYLFGIVPGVGLWRLRVLRERLPAILSAHLAHAVAVVSQSARSQLIAAYTYRPGTTHVIYNGLNLEDFRYSTTERRRVRSEIGVAENQTLIGAASRLSHDKGIDLFVEAAAILLKTHADLHFAIAGEGPERRTIEERIRRADLDSKFTLLGFRTDVAAFMSAIDILVAPSRREAFGYSLIEGMACGRPVVAAAVGGIPEVLEHGGQGVLVAPEDAAALAAGVESVLGSDALRRRLSEHGRGRVARRFSVEEMVSRTATLLFMDSMDPPLIRIGGVERRMGRPTA